MYPLPASIYLQYSFLTRYEFYPEIQIFLTSLFLTSLRGHASTSHKIGIGISNYDIKIYVFETAGHLYSLHEYLGI